MIQANLANARQRWNKAKLTKSAAFWITIGAIIITLFLGFSRGGWVTGSSARKMAESSSQNAVVARLAKYVNEQGWAPMPGETMADNKVATECPR